MKGSIVFLLLVFFCEFSYGQQLSASHMWTNGEMREMSIDVFVDHDNDLATLTFTGPLETWFAYGFGGSDMSDTYAIALERVDATNRITERRLVQYGAGTELVSRIQVLSEVVSGETRTVSLTIPASYEEGGEQYFNFPMVDSSLTIISAGGTDPTLEYHGFNNKLIGFSGGSNALVFSSVVPVTWSRFSLTSDDFDVMLEWETESEVNNEGFFVQRRKSVGDWVDLGFVDAQGERGGEYSFLDEHSLPGTNYYRLKQVDLDGSENFSVIKSIEVQGAGEAGEISLFPNPVVDQLQIQKLLPEGMKRVQVIDMKYQLVHEELVDNGSTAASLNLSTLPSGNYLLMIKNKKWSHISHFVKQ